MKVGKKQISPFHVVMFIGAAIFMAEFVVMLILNGLGPLSFYTEVILDASLLTIFLMPAFYTLIARYPVYAQPLTGIGKIHSPVNALAILSMAIFIGEMLMMVVLGALPPLPPFAEAFVDSFFLLLITTPFLYYFLFMPLVRNLVQLKDAERQLWEVNQRLEEMVEERTRELQSVNVDLKVEISQRKKAEEDLLREKERAQKYLDMAGVIFLVLDGEGRILMVNKKGCHILGCDVGSIIGQNWFDVFVPVKEREKAKAEFMRLLGEVGAADTYAEGNLVTRNGQKKIIGWHATRLNGSDGDVSAILFAGEDITNMKREAEILLRTEKLASISTLSAGVAHEILNPLNIISSIAQLIQLDHRSGQIHDYTNEILAQVKRATKITDSLRMFAHQKKGEMALLNVNDVIDKVFLLMEYELNLNAITVERNFQNDLPLIEGDEEKLMQVFVNLVDNTIDALRGVAGPNIMITTDMRANGVEIRFADNGPGIPPEHLGRIFDPFFTTKDPNKGTGLGLSVVHTIIENHFGDIHAESEPDKGTCFTIWLPLRLPPGRRDAAGRGV